MTPQQIKEARKILGLTQRELELKLGLRGIDVRTVRMWESVKREITGTCTKLIEIFLLHVSEEK